MIKVTFEHYRTQGCRLIGEKPLKKKGKPSKNDLWQHRRKTGFTWGWPAERGGGTTCTISNRHTDQDGKTRDDILATGEALCSMSDNFCYQTGRNVAFSRAIYACPAEFRVDAYLAYQGGERNFAEHMVNMVLENGGEL